MDICKGLEIHHCCTPNALITLKEYSEDYASSGTKEKAENLIKKELKEIQNEKIKDVLENNIKEIENGKRDFRF